MKRLIRKSDRSPRNTFSRRWKYIELGCGTGSTAIVHAPYVKHIQAIEISSKMLAIAQSKADAKNIKNVTFQQSAIDEFNASDQTFNAVLGLSILHLLQSKEEIIGKVHQMLKPGGIFVTSTTCLGDTMKFFKFIAPVGNFLALIPLVKVFTAEEREASFTDAGFNIDYQWQPDKGAAVFIVAKKAT